MIEGDTKILYTYCASCVCNFRRKGFEEAYHVLPLILGVDEKVPLGMQPFFNRAKQERDVASLLSLLNGITEHVRTNMSLGTMLDLGQAAVFSSNFTLQSGHIPFDKTWNYARVNGASVIQADLDENKELILKFLYEE